MSRVESFKVFLIQEPNAIGAQEIRRFQMGYNIVSQFELLREKLQVLFPKLRGKNFTVSWKDAEGDDVVISSNEELKIFLDESSFCDVRKLFVSLPVEYSSSDSREPSARTPRDNMPIHRGIVCDACDKSIQGFRYKCIQCEDYDLCEQCEVQALHPEHCMLRIPTPLYWKSHSGRKLLHHMNRFIKKAMIHTVKEGVRGTECPFKASKQTSQPKQAPTFPRYDATAIECFANYLKEWFSLSGVEEELREVPTATEAKETSSSQKKSGESSKDESHNGADNPHVQFLKTVSDNVAKFLDPLGIDVNVQVKPPAKSDSSNQSGTSSRKASDESVKFPGEGKKLNEASPSKKSGEPSPKSSGSATPVERNAAECEGWIFMSPPQTENGKQTGETPNSIDTILSEFGLRPGVATNATGEAASGGNIASAPPSVQEPTKEANPAQEGGPRSIYPQLPKPEVFAHPNPKIQRAVETMMQMGFSNEGGWLTLLLVSKDGDISKALDVLQPVRF